MKNRTRGGYTLVELITAITLGLFVATLIFSAYTSLFKGFRSQAQRADNIRVMVGAKNTIDHALKTADVLVTASQRQISFLEQGSSVEHTISFYDSTVYRDNTALLRGVGDFAFSVSEKKSRQGYRSVRWEALLSHNTWAGGVAVMKGMKTIDEETK